MCSHKPNLPSTHVNHTVVHSPITENQEKYIRALKLEELKMSGYILDLWAAAVDAEAQGGGFLDDPGRGGRSSRSCRTKKNPSKLKVDRHAK